MALVLSEEQQMLKESARGFLQDHAPLAQLRGLRDERDAKGYSPDTWAQMVKMGWSGVLVPEAYGGVDFGHVGMGQIMEEMGRTLSASPLFATAVLGASALVQGGSEEQKQSYLPAIANGSLTLALAIDEGSVHAPAQVALQAVDSGSGFELNGEKHFVADGHIADQLIVLVRTFGAQGDQEGLSLLLVDRKAPGVEVERIVMADSRNSARIRFNGVSVAETALLGRRDEAWTLIESLIDIGNAHLSAELIGIAQEVFERTVQYMKERKQFGVLIGSYQGLQHRVAHLFSEIELAKSLLINMLQGLDQNRDDINLLVTMAKAKASEVATLATNEAVQLHGGIGMTDEYDMGFYMKRARVAEQMFGDQRFHQRRFATLSGF